MRNWVRKNENLVSVIFLTVISALAYLPLIGRIGYTNDDWYLMYAAGAEGPLTFISLFSGDRPARALVMIPAYELFGNNPLYYNLSAYALRLISAIAFLWLLRMLWPKQSRATFLASLLYLIYPGFLSQHNGIDYQSQMVSLAAAMLSIALSVRALSVQRISSKIILIIFSTLLGWLYLGLVEYFIGFELIRFTCLFLLTYREESLWINRILESIKRWAPNIFTPLIFLIWRLFFFQSERGATDVNLQLEPFMLHPIQIIYHWGIQVMQDMYDVTLSAWVTPFLQLKWYIQTWGVVLAIIAAGLFLYVLISFKSSGGQDAPSGNFTREASLLGLLAAIGGLIPIAMVNRDVSFPSYSRYSLVSSVGVVILVSAILKLVKQPLIRNGLIGLLVFVSVLTQHANTFKAVYLTELTRNFWWQVSWRVPQFKKGSTLIATYPDIGLEEDYFIWGPANLIYYPEKQNEKYVQPGLYAAILNKDTVDKVLARERQEYNKRRNIITYANYRNFVALTQPTLVSCVHVLDGMQPEYSTSESDFVREIGSYSEIEHVLTDNTPHTPPKVVFGTEPAHGWCYYYQKADLARQRGAWDEVQKIGEQAFGQGLEPVDLIEWMPFLQAYAMSGNVGRLQELSSMITVDSYVSQQVCQTLDTMQGISDTVLETANSLYCSK